MFSSCSSSSCSSDCRPPSSTACCSKDSNVACYAKVDVLCHLKCTVQKVSLTRKKQAAPMLSWLTGHQELLFVEIAPKSSDANAKRPSNAGAKQLSNAGAKRTSSGMRSADGNNGKTSQEVWVWEGPSDGQIGAQRSKGEDLHFKVHGSTELLVRVLGSHQDWSKTEVPMETLGEACFQIDDDVLPAMLSKGSLALPLLQDGRVRGTVSLSVWAIPDDGQAPRYPSAQEVASVDQLPVTEKASRLVRLKGHVQPVTCCAVFPCGTKVLTGSNDATAIIWSIIGEEINRLHGHSEGIVACTIFRSGEQVVTVSVDEFGIIWSSSGQRLYSISSIRDCVAFPASDQLLASLASDGAAIYSNAGEQVAVMKGHSQKVTCLAVFPSEEMVLTGSDDDEAIIWSCLGDTLKVLRGHAGPITSCAVFPSGSQVVTGSKDSTAMIWSSVGDAKNMGEHLIVLRGHQAAISCCAVPPSERYVVTVSEDTTGIVWTPKGERHADIRGHAAGIIFAAVFPKDERILTASRDRLAAVWTSEGKQLTDLVGHADAIRDCAIFPSGQHVLTISDDATGIIWPMSTFLNRGRRFRRV